MGFSLPWDRGTARRAQPACFQLVQKSRFGGKSPEESGSTDTGLPSRKGKHNRTTGYNHDVVTELGFVSQPCRCCWANLSSWHITFPSLRCHFLITATGALTYLGFGCEDSSRSCSWGPHKPLLHKEIYSVCLPSRIKRSTVRGGIMQCAENKLPSSCLANEHYGSCTFRKVGDSAGVNAVFLYH